MKKKKLKMVPRQQQVEGHCPVCGEEIELYGGAFDAGDGEYREDFKCAACGAKGTQLRSLVFDGFDLED